MKERLRIAVADDEADMREFFREALGRLGHDVVAECGDGRELLDACRRLRPDCVITDVKTVRPERAVAISCDAPTDDLLLVDWLNALVYEMATRCMLFSTFVVAIEDSHLHATAWGEPVDRARHEPAVEVKGATYTALRVEQLEDGHWLVQCVVDV